MKGVYSMLTRCLMIVFILTLSGCIKGNMFFAEHTHFGLQAKVNPTENKPVDINMGYDRGIFTLVPKKNVSGTPEAASVVSKTGLCVRFVSKGVVKSVYASGAAANMITGKSKSAEALFKSTPHECED